MDDLQLLTGQRVLVIGGSGAMGVAVARLARRHGAALTLVGRDADRLAEAARTIGDSVATGHRCA